MLRIVQADFAANESDPKAKFVVLFFRLAHAARAARRMRSLWMPLVALYRVIVEGVLGIEIRPKTQIGPGLRIFHGVGIVINDQAKLGHHVTLRHGVTIGSRFDGGPCPTVGDYVEFGAGAIVLGGITIGDGAKIGAGAVVLQDVPPGWKAYGNPAQVVSGD